MAASPKPPIYGLLAVEATEVNEDGSPKKAHKLPSKYTMFIPAFRGVDCLKGEDGKWIEGLTNPRGFILADKHQRNPKYANIFSVGVCVAVPPYEATPLAVGMPKTGYMIESMVTATAHNIRDLIAGKAPTHVPTWNAVCLADFGNSGVAFIAIPQIPPRNVNWSGRGYWKHLAKIGFEKYFLNKVRKGSSEPGYERFLMKPSASNGSSDPLSGRKRLPDSARGRRNRASRRRPTSDWLKQRGGNPPRRDRAADSWPIGPPRCRARAHFPAPLYALKASLPGFPSGLSSGERRRATPFRRRR